MKAHTCLIELRTETDRDLAHKLLDESPDGAIFELRPPRRSDPANRRLHASIRDVAEQVEWAGGYLSEEDWKRIFVASLYGQKVVAGLLGGFVVLTKKTADMSSADVSELQDFIYAWGSERGVVWSEE